MFSNESKMSFTTTQHFVKISQGSFMAFIYSSKVLTGSKKISRDYLNILTDRFKYVNISENKMGFL